MNGNHLSICAVGAIAIGILVYLAYDQTGERPIPQVQGEGQVMGLGVQAGMSVNAGTPLDLRPEVHFWSPGFERNPAQPTISMCHRYPSVPGGNISTVMHKGWGAFNTDTPADNDWRVTPPEAAVI